MMKSLRLTRTGYYGCALDLDKTDNRLQGYENQRNTLGFDDTETWNLDWTLVEFLQPRLKRYLEIAPIAWDADKYHKKMYKGLREASEILNKAVEVENDIERKGVDISKALKIFAQYYGGIWW